MPAEIEALIGKVQYEIGGEFPVEQGYIFTSCSSVENGNPLFWDDATAAELTGGPIAPPTMVSVWFRPHHWSPGRTEQPMPLQVHRREGEPCPRCGTPIRKMRAAGRGTYFCPKCQPRPRKRRG